MREFKFRAWDGSKMHYDVAPWQWDFVISRSWHRCEKSNGSGILGSGGSEGEFLVPGIRFKELMQFTNLLDADGKEIYEGDTDGAGNVVEFVNGSWCLNGDRRISSDFIVQGNIHDK